MVSKQMIPSLYHNKEFKALILGIKANGKILVDNFNIYFCTNDKRFNGASHSLSKFEYSYSWIYDDQITNIYIKENKKWVKFKIPYLFGHSVEVKRNKFVIGCGEVVLTRKEIQEYINGYKILKDLKKYSGFEKIQKILFEHEITIDDKKFEEIKSLLKLR